MTLRQLEFVKAVVENRNISLAAKQLYVSQSALSQQIAALEEELGCALFYRKTNGVTPTNAGYVLYQHALEIIGNVSDTLDDVRKADKTVAGEIIIGTIYSGLSIAADYIERFTTLYPEVHFKIFPMLPAELEDSLEAGKIDVAFMRSVNRSIRRFPALWLEKEEMVAMIPRHMDPCPDSNVIRVDQLKDLAFCGGIDKHYRESRNWDFGEMLEKELSEKGEQFARIYECSGAIASMILSANGLAVSLVPEKTARSVDSGNLSIKHVEDTEMYTWPAVAWNDDVTSSYQVTLFVKFISDDVMK